MRLLGILALGYETFGHPGIKEQEFGRFSIRVRDFWAFRFEGARLSGIWV
jgi:hypothetical protein